MRIENIGSTQKLFEELKVREALSRAQAWYFVSEPAQPSPYSQAHGASAGFRSRLASQYFFTHHCPMVRPFGIAIPGTLYHVISRGD
jgi:hypothetical protein